MRAALALLFALALTGCGFSPMYGSAGPGGGDGPAIGAVDIGLIYGKAGHSLRTELDRLLAVEAASGPPQRLEIAISEEVIGLGLRLDESASRAELRLLASYVFYPTNAEQPLRGSLTTIVNYEVPRAAFGVIAAQDDARERAAEIMAQRMRAELALRLSQARQPS